LFKNDFKRKPVTSFKMADTDNNSESKRREYISGITVLLT
jgi:hypothetical protein